MGRSENKVRMWQDEAGGKAYFFLPSCVLHHKIRFGNLSGNHVIIDGKPFERGDTFVWEEGNEYQVQIDIAQEVYIYELTLMKSDNIPAIFIDTDSGSMEYLNEDKENEEKGRVCVVREDGNTEYQGELERISGRGNSTWRYKKKPYAIKLQEKYPLCGLDKGDKWCLLALWREGSKLDSKVAMDLAQEMGLEYSVQGVWIDLYLNGEYTGIYLLAESVSVGEGRVDIYDLEKDNEKYNVNIDNAVRYEEESNKGYLLENDKNITGGYLIEKDFPSYYVMENCGFTTSNENQFTIKEPQYASMEQVQYIQNYVDRLDQMVQNGQSEVWEFLEVESFAKRFLLDEISLNADTGLTSMYFYKERDDSKLYSGPAWDYDNAFGDGESNLYGNRGYDYEYSVLEMCAELPNRLNWYTRLYETPEMRQCVIEEYINLMPFFEELLDYGIDEYVSMIEASVKMDCVLWADTDTAEDFTGKYNDFYANIKYMKYFIAKRLNWLCTRWGVEHEEYIAPSSGEMHLVTFVNHGEVVGTMEIMDGMELQEPLKYDESIYQGWRNEYNGEEFRWKIPIYDDIVFYAIKRE